MEPAAFLRRRTEVLRRPGTTVCEEPVDGRTVAILRHPMADGGWVATDRGMGITAEGVEPRDQLDRLRQDGCDEIQGYCFSRPVPAAEVAGLLLKWDAVPA